MWAVFVWAMYVGDIMRAVYVWAIHVWAIHVGDIEWAMGCGRWMWAMERGRCYVAFASCKNFENCAATVDIGRILGKRSVKKHSSTGTPGKRVEVYGQRPQISVAITSEVHDTLLQGHDLKICDGADSCVNLAPTHSGAAKARLNLPLLECETEALFHTGTRNSAHHAEGYQTPLSMTAPQFAKKQMQNRPPTMFVFDLFYWT
jgi:hypothetical protein